MFAEKKQPSKPQQPRRAVDFNTTVLRHLNDVYETRYGLRRSHYRPYTSNYLQDHEMFRVKVPFTGTCNEDPYEGVCGKHVHTSVNKSKSPIYVVKWTPGGRRLLTGSQSGEFTLWNSVTFNYIRLEQASDSGIRAVSWSKDEHRMLCGENSGKISVWSQTITKVAELPLAHQAVVCDLDFSPVSGLDYKFVSCSDDGTVAVWDLNRFVDPLERNEGGEKGRELELRGHGNEVKSCRWHPSMSLVATGSKDTFVKLWDPRVEARTGDMSVMTLTSHKGTVIRVRWHPTRCCDSRDCTSA